MDVSKISDARSNWERPTEILSAEQLPKQQTISYEELGDEIPWASGDNLGKTRASGNQGNETTAVIPDEEMDLNLTLPPEESKVLNAPLPYIGRTPSIREVEEAVPSDNPSPQSVTPPESFSQAEQTEEQYLEIRRQLSEKYIKHVDDSNPFQRLEEIKEEVDEMPELPFKSMIIFIGEIEEEIESHKLKLVYTC